MQSVRRLLLVTAAVLAGIVAANATAQMTPLQQLELNAKQNAASNVEQFSDGSGPYWAAGHSFLSQGVFADDLTLAAISDPIDFDAASLENIIGKFIGAANSKGELAVGIAANGTAVTFWSSFDSLHAHASGDGALMLPQLEYTAWQKSGSTAGIATHIAALSKALGTIQIDSSNHLCNVVAGNQWMPWLFEETALLTGDVTMCSVWLARDYQVMTLMYTAIGNGSMAALYYSKERAILASLSGTSSPLWNPTAGMYNMSTGQNSTNIDVDGSALMVYLGFATSAQSRAISKWLVRNLSTIEPVPNGFLRQSNGNFAFCGSINSDGTQAVQTTGLCASGKYQQGTWTTQFGWVANAVSLTSPSTATGLITSLLSNKNPASEWIGIGGGGGSTNNLESTMGPLDFALKHPSLMPTANTLIQDVKGR